MKTPLPSTSKNFLLYSTQNGEVKVDVFLENETIWLSQKSMANLFDCSTENIRLHLKNIYETAELKENRTSKDFLVVQKEEILTDKGNISKIEAENKATQEFSEFKNLIKTLC